MSQTLQPEKWLVASRLSPAQVLASAIGVEGPQGVREWKVGQIKL